MIIRGFDTVDDYEDAKLFPGGRLIDREGGEFIVCSIELSLSSPFSKLFDAESGTLIDHDNLKFPVRLMGETPYSIPFEYLKRKQ